MGIGSYFKFKGPTTPHIRAQTSEKHGTKDQPQLEIPVGGSLRYEAGGASSQSSLAPSMRSVQSPYLGDIKHEVLVTYLYQQQCSRLWVSDGSGEIEGVLLRKARNQYLACPPALANSSFAIACADLNVQVAMTVHSRVITTFLAWSPDAIDVPLMNGHRVQILPTIHDLPRARKHQFAAFLASDALLIVWDDDPSHLMERAGAIESELLELVWQASAQQEVREANKDEKVCRNTQLEVDRESGEIIPEERPTNLINTILVAFTLLIILTLLGLGFRSVAVEVAVDKGYTRLAFFALTPVQVFFTLFFSQVIVGCIAQCVGPVRQMQENSKYFSAKCSPRLQNRTLPHITVQCPVYKEGLTSVIAPTVKSIKQAISTYELQGGSANMFINDDGLQIIDEVERRARIDFYADHSIGWTARPKHGSEGFLRRGKFKKVRKFFDFLMSYQFLQFSSSGELQEVMQPEISDVCAKYLNRFSVAYITQQASNMNFGLMLSCNVEEKLLRHPRTEGWNRADEAEAYEGYLKEVLKENGRAWADGNIRIGDYIVLIDSDTRVPADCLLDAASEMEQSPNVGILQFSSGVMQVVNNYFENGITFFTDLIYTAINYTVANGDVAPFVGHNAILRWSAIQQVSYTDEDGYEKFWSESHVSEDFDMSLRLQCHGYIIRLATWADGGFKEGVSLTVYDELARWEKYAYGCNELLFHPIRQWIYKGPFTELFRLFLFSNIRFTSKITIISYIGTYYAIGAAWIMTTANYLAIGWFNGYLDKYYIDSWKVWFSIVIVFNGLGNVALAVMRYRIGEKSFFAAIAENFKWTLMLAIFLGGLSLHVSQALLAHMFEVDMTWGATSKEAEFSNFFIEVPRVLRRFKWSMSFALLGIVAMIVLARAPFIPFSWAITDFIAILPMATVTASHLLLPIVLNPALMTFSW